MDTSTESLLMLASGASRRCGDGEGPLLAGAAQAVPVALLPTASPPPQLPARRLPLPATASLRCGLPAPDHRCQGRAGGGREWGGPFNSRFFMERRSDKANQSDTIEKYLTTCIVSGGRPCRIQNHYRNGAKPCQQHF